MVKVKLNLALAGIALMLASLSVPSDLNFSFLTSQLIQPLLFFGSILTAILSISTNAGAAVAPLMIVGFPILYASGFTIPTINSTVVFGSAIILSCVEILEGIYDRQKS